MPSARSPPASAAATRLASSSLVSAASSVIALTLLPFAPLQAEPGDQDRAEEERDHRRGDRGALAEMAAQDGALIGQRRHQLGRVDRPAARQHPDELEIR